VPPAPASRLAARRASSLACVLQLLVVSTLYERACAQLRNVGEQLRVALLMCMSFKAEQDGAQLSPVLIESRSVAKDPSENTERVNP
jgi:hypothetical protein